jgi:hypothetical protein
MASRSVRPARTARLPGATQTGSHPKSASNGSRLTKRSSSIELCAASMRSNGSARFAAPTAIVVASTAIVVMPPPAGVAPVGVDGRSERSLRTRPDELAQTYACPRIVRRDQPDRAQGALFCAKNARTQEICIAAVMIISRSACRSGAASSAARAGRKNCVTLLGLSSQRGACRDPFAIPLHVPLSTPVCSK